MITLEPIGGLGNRMRAIDSALALARELSIPLRVVWTRTDDCRCPWHQLFEPPPGARIIERGWSANRVLRRVEISGRRYSREIRHDEMTRLLAERYDFRALARERSTFIQTFSRFFPSAGRPYEAFTPIHDLRAEVDRAARSFGPRTLGIHVRRGDHAPGRRSPTSAFVERMRAEIAADPLTRFFVATDSPEVEADLCQWFGDRVIARPKTTSRVTVAGIRDAVIELYVLARTARVIGTFFSSYSETAAEIGGIPLDVIDRPEAGAT